LGSRQEPIQPQETQPMYRVCSIFSQVLKLFSRGDFEKAVKEHKAERHARGFTSWGQFMAMLFCQLGRAHSLREICGGLACCEGQLKHLGVPVAPKRSTLAYANENRPWELYQTVFEQTLFKCQELVRSQGGRKKFRFKNKLMSLDGSIIDLSVSMFDWAKYRRTKGAIKLHLLLDHDGYLPSFAVVTEGKTSEIKVARTLRFAPGTILAIDRGYNDYEWFRELTQEEVYFVTRMKENAVYEVKEEVQVPQNSNVVRDQIICFPRLKREGEEPVPVSYTHLRAHETRHDLVCRLLLEKKKKNKTEIQYPNYPAIKKCEQKTKIIIN